MKKSTIRNQKKQKKIEKLFFERLKKEGYIIEQFENTPKQYAIKGNCIYGFINTNINSTTFWTDGMIVIDHKNCFQKTSRCPCCIYIPQTEEKIEYIIQQLKFWGTDEGFKISNEYEENKWINEYIKKIK
jgi:hypothetical protein